MADTPKPNRWNSLLETLGLPTTEHVPAPPPAAETPPPPRPSLPPRDKPAPKPKTAPKPARSWSAIAGDLGLEVPPDPIPQQPASSPPPARPRPAAEAPPSRPRPAEEPPAMGSTQSGRSPLDDIFGEKEGDVDVFGLSGGR